MGPTPIVAAQPGCAVVVKRTERTDGLQRTTIVDANDDDGLWRILPLIGALEEDGVTTCRESAGGDWQVWGAVPIIVRIEGHVDELAGAVHPSDAASPSACRL